MSEANPILNNPHEESTLHYATDLDGELNYTRPVPGRRVFTGSLATVPIRRKGQRELLELHEQREQYDPNREEQSSLILIERGNGTVDELSEVSSSVHTLTHTSTLVRLYFPAEARDEIQRLLD